MPGAGFVKAGVSGKAPLEGELPAKRAEGFQVTFSIDQRRNKAMDKYECPCGYVYDPEVGDPDGGIAPGTAFEDIPEDWVCPVCGLGKDAFTKA